MKIFQTIQKNLDVIGFRANDSSLLNKENVRAILVSIPAITSQFVYVLCEVNSVEQYLRSFCMITAGTGVFISFGTTIFKKTELNDLIDQFQAITIKGK